MLEMKIKRLHLDAINPHKAHESDSGFDLYTCEALQIEPYSTGIAKTGIALQLPQGYEMMIRPRSGVSVNTPSRVIIGTIDSGYTGEIGIIVDNPTDKTMVIVSGTKLAQGIVQQLPTVTTTIVQEFDSTDRGASGYGSTGE